jgi:peptide/nickel transport system substrate-binding protein
VGTGAFKFVNGCRATGSTLVPATRLLGRRPRLETATFKFISDPTAAFAAMMAEDIDAFSGFPAPENLPQFEADPRFQVLVGSTEGETILSTNNKLPPLDNARARSAISHAIDRQAIIDGAMFGLWHADRHAFRAAQPRLCRSDRAIGLRSRPRRQCWPRPGCPTGSPPR